MVDEHDRIGHLAVQRLALGAHALQRTGWIVVEQDILPGMGDPKASARRNREYLASIGL